MGLLDRSASFLTDRTGTAGGVTVTYTRASSYTVAAVLGESRAEAQQTTPPGRIDWREIDFLIAVADYPAALGLPAVGDRLALDLGGASRTFELMRRGAEPDWRYTDASRTCFRLHCKQVG